MTAYLADVAAAATIVVATLAAVVATEPAGYRCRACGWSTGARAALPAWARWRWHRHVTRSRFGRCGRPR